MALGSRVLRWASAALATTGLVVMSGGWPASAAGVVTAVDGSALGYHSFGINLIGNHQPDVGPTPTVALAGDASNSPQSATATTGVVAYGPGTLFTSDGISLQTSASLGSTGSVTTTSSVNDINKATTQKGTGSEALTADNISSSCTGSTSAAASGSTSVTNGTLVTDNSTNPPTVMTVPASPAPNTTMSGKVQLNATQTDNFHYVFNEQTTDAAGNLTVNAVHEYFDGPNLKGNLIIGQVVCGLTIAQPADLSLQNPGITHAPNPVPAGQDVTFTITASNLGPDAATGVTDVSMVTGGKLVSATPSAGTCGMSKKMKNAVSCTFSSIAANGSATVQIAVTAPKKSGGTVSISSTVSYVADTNSANDSATDSVAVQ